MFFYHLSGLGYDVGAYDFMGARAKAWDFKKPAEAEDVCVQSVYRRAWQAHLLAKLSGWHALPISPKIRRRLLFQKDRIVRLDARLVVKFPSSDRARMLALATWRRALVAFSLLRLS